MGHAVFILQAGVCAGQWHKTYLCVEHGVETVASNWGSLVIPYRVIIHGATIIATEPI